MLLSSCYNSILAYRTVPVGVCALYFFLCYSKMIFSSTPTLSGLHHCQASKSLVVVTSFSLETMHKVFSVEF